MYAMQKFMQAEVKADGSVEVSLNRTAIYELSLLTDDQIGALMAFVRVRELELVTAAQEQPEKTLKKLRQNLSDEIIEIRKREE